MNTEERDWRQHYLFSALNDEQRRAMRSHSRPRRLAAGQTLFAQGDRARHFWWLESGQIKLYRLSRDGHQKVMGIVGPHHSFAEGVLFMDDPRYPVNAEAVTAGKAIGFEREAYLEVLSTSFAACRALLRRMVQRTQRHLDEIEALTIQNARYRLVHYLLRLNNSAGGTVKLPATKQLIAAQLAMQPETLSRLFRELEQDGLIEMRGSTVRIVDALTLEGAL
ncbi:MAG: Crp/Fnr family transcriptional regulator [Gammaproteobacteria bacterium]|nr:Crp/Fnr family transcriptional regulator [Gammaproteobacteria bacterium]